MKEEEDCEGCRTKNASGKTCSKFRFNLVCPCSICLIKIMCMEPCDIFDSYIEKIRNLKGVNNV
jgi:hypothetical protein